MPRHASTTKHLACVKALSACKPSPFLCMHCHSTLGGYQLFLGMRLTLTFASRLACTHLRATCFLKECSLHTNV